jgi:methyl-accepting chemotaxis protein
MDEQGEGSKQILEALSQINTITSRVRDGSVEMLEGSRNIDDEMQKLLVVSERLQSRTSELNMGTDAVKEAVSLARTTSQNTIDLAAGVSAQVGKFKLT